MAETICLLGPCPTTRTGAREGYVYQCKYLGHTVSVLGVLSSALFMKDKLFDALTDAAQ
jgi:hypothetical protein